MANKDDYLNDYRVFFENFAKTHDPEDQLPVRVANYKLVNREVVGGVVEWSFHYLTQKDCPPHLIAPLTKIVISEFRRECKKDPVLCGFIPEDNFYEPLKLMQSVMAKINEICLRYLENSLLCSLPPPDQNYNIVSVYAIKNNRRRMEDRHVIVHDLNTTFSIQNATSSSYYAIFDGHAGSEAAAYSAAHLHQFLVESKYFITDPERALYDAFSKTDTSFVSKCKAENYTSGTTAVCALLQPKEKTLYIAWAGDSQAILVNQGKVLQCVEPHKPDREDERDRIEKLGGCVIYWGIWRVNGKIAVSRSIGDSEYKPYLTAIPEIREIPLDGNEEFLILGCDGLWDDVSEGEAAKTVYDLVYDKPDDTERISHRLVQLAKEKGSRDNITVIVVFLRDPHQIAAGPRWADRVTSYENMETDLDNANNSNPFANSNGSTMTTTAQEEDNNFHTQKSEPGLLLNLAENTYKHNGGTELTTNEEFFKALEKNTCKRAASDFDDDDDDDDFGPETDIDTVDDVLMSPSIAAAKANDTCNLFPEGETTAIDLHEQKEHHFEDDDEKVGGGLENRIPTPHGDADRDAGRLIDGGVLVDSESEDEEEWNYMRGEEANKENVKPGHLSLQADDILLEAGEDGNMSQLNPDAAEFVPVSPTRSVPSPIAAHLLKDDVISQSPRKPPPNDVDDLSVPEPNEFEDGVKSKPSEIGDEAFSNGHGNEDADHKAKAHADSNRDENLCETGTSKANDEFHFGPNATPFTPTRLHDQSESVSSTRAVFGDESVATLGTSFDDSNLLRDQSDFVALQPNKNEDPMSMSFHQDRDDATNPFDLDKVQMLPDDVDEFIKDVSDKKETAEDVVALSASAAADSFMDQTISDLREHFPLGTPLKEDETLGAADLDKEVASPVEDNDRAIEQICNAIDQVIESHEKESSAIGQFCEMKSVKTVDDEGGEKLDIICEIRSISPGGEGSGDNSTRVLSPASDLVENIDDIPLKFEDLLVEDHESVPIFGLEKPIRNEEEEKETIEEKEANEQKQVVEENILDDIRTNYPEPNQFGCYRRDPEEVPYPFEENIRRDEPVNLLGDVNRIDSEQDRFGSEAEDSCPFGSVRKDEPIEHHAFGEAHRVDDTHQNSFGDIQRDGEARFGDLTSSAIIEDVVEEKRSELLDATIDDSLEEARVTTNTDDALGTIESTFDSNVCEFSSPIQNVDNLISCPIASPRSIPDTESVTTAEVNSFLDRSVLSEVASPLKSPDDLVSDTAALTHAHFYPGFDSYYHQQPEIQHQQVSNLVDAQIHHYRTSPDLREPIESRLVDSATLEDSKHEIMTAPVSVAIDPVFAPTAPVFVEATAPVLSPTIEVARPTVDDVNTSGVSSSDVAGSEVNQSGRVSANENITAAVSKAALGGAASSGVVGMAVAAKRKPKTPTANKLVTSAPKLSPIKPPGSKPFTTSTTVKPTTTARPKPAPPATATAKTASSRPSPATTTTRAPISRATAAAPLGSSRPKPATKLAEKKPLLTNGEAKPTASSGTTRKVESTIGKSTARTLTATRSPSKTSPTSNEKTPAAKPATTTSGARPRPNTLLSAKPMTARPATTATKPSAVTTTTRTTTVTNSTRAALPTPRPRPTTAPSAAKPRVPISRSALAKPGPDTEKQNKESSNKLTASRSTTARTTASSTRKIEAKASATRTTTATKTSTTVASSKSTTKKPVDLTKNVIRKTTVTKVETSQQNGGVAASTITTEQIITNGTTATTNGLEGPQLVKDNSPVDNKLIIDHHLIDTTAAD